MKLPLWVLLYISLNVTAIAAVNLIAKTNIAFL